MICNYRLVGCEVAQVCRLGKRDDDDGTCHFRKERKLFVFNFEHIITEIYP